MIAEDIANQLLCPIIVPADDDERTAQAMRSNATIVIVDLESLVASPNKTAARSAVSKLLSSRDNDRIAVRVNRVRSSLGVNDLLAVLNASHPAAAIIIPLMEDTRELDVVADMLGSSPIPLVPIIESVAGLKQVYTIATHPKASGLVFGAGDFSAELRIDRSWNSLLAARTQMVGAAIMASKVVIDAPFIPAIDIAALRAECALAKALGMHGKVAVTCPQLEVIRQAFGYKRHDAALD